jgi:hypothetical protein
MAFRTRGFHAGSNVTVRLGDKWLKHWQNDKREFVPLDATGRPIKAGDKVYRGHILEVAYVPINLVEPRWLMNMQGPRPDNVLELQNQLVQQYNTEIAADDYVTVIRFTITTQES